MRWIRPGDVLQMPMPRASPWCTHCSIARQVSSISGYWSPSLGVPDQQHGSDRTLTQYQSALIHLSLPSRLTLVANGQCMRYAST